MGRNQRLMWTGKGPNREKDTEERILAQSTKWMVTKKVKENTKRIHTLDCVRFLSILLLSTHGQHS